MNDPIPAALEKMVAAQRELLNALEVLNGIEEGATKYARAYLCALAVPDRARVLHEFRSVLRGVGCWGDYPEEDRPAIACEAASRAGRGLGFSFEDLHAALLAEEMQLKQICTPAAEEALARIAAHFSALPPAVVIERALVFYVECMIPPAASGPAAGPAVPGACAA